MKTPLTRQSKWLARLFAIFLVVSLLAALVPATGLAATKCDTSFEVRRGDTLTKIGKAFGFSGSQIAAENSLKKPYAIYVGQRLCIPEKSTTVSKLDTKYTSAVAAYFVAGRTSTGEVIIVTYNYPKTNVKIRGYNAASSSRTLYSIGSLNISSVGNGHAFRFKLPSAIKNATKLMVCLKDQTSNYLQCALPRAGS